MLWPQPYVICIGVLALAPFVGLGIAAASDGALGVFEEEGGLRGDDVSSVVVLPVLALALRALHDVALIDWWPPLLAAVAATIAAALGLIWRASQMTYGVALLAGPFAGLYVWAAAIEVNALVLPPTTSFATTEVASKRETGGRNYLTLAAPRYRGVPKEVDVSWDLYRAVQPGDEVCVQVHHGVFGWRWWEVTFCPA